MRKMYAFCLALGLMAGCSIDHTESASTLYDRNASCALDDQPSLDQDNTTAQAGNCNSCPRDCCQVGTRIGCCPR